MNTKLSQPRFPLRFAMVAGAFALFGAAQADLKLSVSVTVSGETDAKSPASGSYEVDFRSGMARVVHPNGRVQLYDFSTSQVASLDPEAKTFYMEDLQSVVNPKGRSTRSAIFSKDNSTAAQTQFGATASRYLIGTQSNGFAATASYGVGRRHGGRSGSSTTVVGSAWVAEGTNVKSSVTSFAPLVELGVPKELAASITQQLNQYNAIPLSFTFTGGGNAQGRSITMSVTAIDAAAQQASLYQIPSGYKSVSKPTHK